MDAQPWRVLQAGTIPHNCTILPPPNRLLLTLSHTQYMSTYMHDKRS